MKYPSYSIMHRSFEVATPRKTKHRTSWISVLLEALYESRRRQAIGDIRRHRHLFRWSEHVALHEQVVGERWAVPGGRKAAAPIKFSLSLIMVRGALIAVAVLFVVLLLRVLA